VKLRGVCTKPTDLTHPRLFAVRSLGQPIRTRKIFQIGGWSPPIEFGVHNSSYDNLMRGLLERVFYVKRDGVFTSTPKPLEGVYSERLGYFKELLRRRIGRATPMRREDFPLLYQGRKRTIYQDAVESLALKKVCRDDAKLKTFVKAEKINFTSKGDPAPRVIQPRDPRYNVEVGRYLKPLEPKIYKAVERIFGDVTIFKGLNAQDSGRKMYNKWRRYVKPVAIGLDASRFDQHVSKAALEWEHSCYTQCFQSPSELAGLLQWQIGNRGVGYVRDGKVKYSVEGCRMSGDMNTALGNCVIMCALVHAYCRHVGIDKFSLANNGDDCVVIMETSDYERFSEGLQQWFLEMGFNMVVEPPVYDFERIEFCQTHPVRVEDVYIPSKGITVPQFIMCRSAPVALAKDCMSIKHLDSRAVYEKQMTAVGECGLALTGGLPVFQAFYQGMIRAGRGRRFKRTDQVYMANSGKEMLRAGMKRVAGQVSEESRYSFWLAFGITPEEQISLESYYNSHTTLWSEPKLLDHPHCLPNWFGM
jgi:hypothetical protein